MKIVVEASSLLVTAIRKINEGQKNVGITLQKNQAFPDWQQYQRSCKIYALTLLYYKNMNSIIKRLPLLTKLRYI